MFALGRPTVSLGRKRQEQLEHAIAMRIPRSPSFHRDHMQYLQEQLAYKNAQLKHAKSQRDTHLVQKTHLTHMRLLRSETPNWKSLLVRKSAEAAKGQSSYSKPWTSSIEPIGRKQKLA